MPHTLPRGYIPRADVMLYLVVIPDLMNQNICSIVTLVDVFVQALDSCYRHTGFDIDVAIEFLAEVGIIWNNELWLSNKTGSFLPGTRFSTVLLSCLC